LKSQPINICIDICKRCLVVNVKGGNDSIYGYESQTRLRAFCTSYDHCHAFYSGSCNVAEAKTKEFPHNLASKSFPPTWRNFKDYLELRDHGKAYRDDGDVDQPRFGSERLSYDGLLGILTRRAHEAGVEEPALHDFRRAFALSMLRNGTDIFTLAKMMGHEGISVLQRYLKQTTWIPKKLIDELVRWIMVGYRISLGKAKSTIS
jgi:hypothetical protein